MAFPYKAAEQPDKKAKKKKSAHEKWKEISLWMVKRAWRRDDPHENILDKERWTHLKP